MSRVLRAIAAHAAKQPPAAALSGGGVSFDYAQLAQAVRETSDWLGEAFAGRPDGAPVALALDNGPAWVVLDLALIALGRPNVPLPPFFAAEQRAHVLADCGATLLLRAAQPGETADAVVAGTPLVAQPLDLAPRALPAGTAKITYTSGSTGRPKGVCLSQAQMEAVAASLVQVLGAEYAGVHLPVLPLGVLLENVAGLYALLLAGGRYHAASLGELGYAGGLAPDFARLAEAIDTHRATSLILTPELLRGLAAWLAANDRRLPSLQLVAVGGAKVPPQLIAAARGVGLPVYEGYGLSECASVVALNAPGHDRPGTVGRALPHVELRVADDGELLVGPAPFLGYVGGPAQAGPFATGDLGGVDADGFVSILGRKSNLLITAFGRNVAPEWVESELLAQPEIGQSVVFGDGQAALCALVVPAGPHVPAAALAAAVERANAALPIYARVGRWRASRPFEVGRGELTVNGRPRRAALAAAGQDLIQPQG